MAINYTIDTLFNSLLFFNKKWRSNKFPMFNAWLIELTGKLIFRKRKKKVKVMNQEALIDNKFFIPCFSNVALDYEASGDYGKYLTNIEISNIFDKNDQEWFCIFHFSQTPKTGELKLEYI